MGKFNEMEQALDDVAQQIAESTEGWEYAQRRAFLVRLKEETEAHIRDLDAEEGVTDGEGTELSEDGRDAADAGRASEAARGSGKGEAEATDARRIRDRRPRSERGSVRRASDRAAAEGTLTTESEADRIAACSLKGIRVE